MGRIFETRKHVMFARWNRMAKQFTRIGKDITIAVKASGPDPDNNPTLRRVIQNARSVNMPKDKVEAAIKRASGKDVANYEEVIYEGYAPHGVAVLVAGRHRQSHPDGQQRAQCLQQERWQFWHVRQRQFHVPAHGRLPAGPRRASIRTTSSCT